MGVIFVRDLSVEAVIGVAEHERGAPREILVNLELEADLERASASDDLAHAIDYAAVAEAVRAHARESSFRLLEAFAGSIADLVLARFPGVGAVSVGVEKAWAVPGVRSVGVTLRRSRQRKTAETQKRRKKKGKKTR